MGFVGPAQAKFFKLNIFYELNVSTQLEMIGFMLV